MNETLRRDVFAWVLFQQGSDRYGRQNSAPSTRDAPNARHFVPGVKFLRSVPRVWGCSTSRLASGSKTGCIDSSGDIRCNRMVAILAVNKRSLSGFVDTLDFRMWVTVCVSVYSPKKILTVDLSRRSAPVSVR